MSNDTTYIIDELDTNWYPYGKVQEFKNTYLGVPVPMSDQVDALIYANSEAHKAKVMYDKLLALSNELGKYSPNKNHALLRQVIILTATIALNVNENMGDVFINRVQRLCKQFGLKLQREQNEIDGAQMQALQRRLDEMTILWNNSQRICADREYTITSLRKDLDDALARYDNAVRAAARQLRDEELGVLGQIAAEDDAMDRRFKLLELE